MKGPSKSSQSSCQKQPSTSSYYQPPPFVPLPHDLIVEETRLFGKVQADWTAAWEEECLLYEQTMTMSINSQSTVVPRRNYLNAEGVVTDTNLFPYHAACYPLLDAYDCLYEEDEDSLVGSGTVAANHVNNPISADAIRKCDYVPLAHRRRYSFGHPILVQGFMPCSTLAIFKSLFPILL
jgi:hypothetical protein